MELKAFAVKDLKSGAFSAPFFAPSIGEGERVFAKLARNPETNINQFQSDFDLYHVGIYNDADSNYQPCVPQHLTSAINAAKAQ